MVDLECRVVDSVLVVDESFEFASDRVAVVARVDEDVRGERGEVRADRPDVQVVDVFDVWVRRERLTERVDVDIVGCCFEKDAARVAKKTVCGANHDRRDDQRGDPVCAGRSRW